MPAPIGATSIASRRDAWIHWGFRRRYAARDHGRRGFQAFQRLAKLNSPLRYV